MERLTYFCSLALVLACGYVYAYTLLRREERRTETAVSAVGYLMTAGIINCLPLEKFKVWYIACLCLCFPFLLIFLYRGWKIKLREAVYYGIWSYMTWLILVENWMICCTMLPVTIGCPVWFGWCVGFLVFVFVLCVIAMTIGKWMPEQGKKKIGPRQSCLAIFMSLIYAGTGSFIHYYGISAEYFQWVPLFLFQLMLLLILYLQNEMFKKSDIKQELEVMNLLWKKEQEQYRLSKENIALINQKCHDLKHQIRALRNSTEEGTREYLREIENSIQIYETFVKTGNEVLDTILTEKSLYCKEKDITVSCVADGSQLGFIHTVDLYAILGNALDNAIEAVEKLEEKEKRQIDVLIYKQQQFLAMNIINPMEKTLVYEDELPVTTKGDKNYHGYGLRSIQYLLKKYDGTLSISNEDNCFSLMMLLPIPKENHMV